MILIRKFSRNQRNCVRAGIDLASFEAKSEEERKAAYERFREIEHGDADNSSTVARYTAAVRTSTRSLHRLASLPPATSGGNCNPAFLAKSKFFSALVSSEGG